MPTAGIKLRQRAPGMGATDQVAVRPELVSDIGGARQAVVMQQKGHAITAQFDVALKHPVAVARAVMEHTPHVMLVGQGALDFALAQGFTAENLLTAESEQEWRQWLKDANYRPIVNIENHDTIGMLALDSQGNLGGACTTSGMAFKMHGRVGDSPIIGAGLYVDNEIGAATATGHGEEVIRVTGSFLVVELMRQGYSPQQACEQAVQRIYHKLKLRNGNIADTQIGFIALNKKGEYGSYCLQPGFNYAVQQPGGSKLYPAAALLSG